MTENSVYKVIELIGSSPTSWQNAVEIVIDKASKTLNDLRVAEVKELDVKLDGKGKIEAYRAKVRLSFKYQKEKD